MRLGIGKRLLVLIGQLVIIESRYLKVCIKLRDVIPFKLRDVMSVDSMTGSSNRAIFATDQ